MNDAAIDYAGGVPGLPGMVALLTPELVYADANEEFLRLSGRTREQLVGRYLFDVFPDNPDDHGGIRYAQPGGLAAAGAGHRRARQPWRCSATTWRAPDRPGSGRSATGARSTPRCSAATGKVALLVHRVEEVTELIRARGGARRRAGRRVLEAELYTRARELQELNERLRAGARPRARGRPRPAGRDAARAPAGRPPPRGRALPARRRRAQRVRRLVRPGRPGRRRPHRGRRRRRRRARPGGRVRHGPAAQRPERRLPRRRRPGQALDVLGLYAHVRGRRRVHHRGARPSSTATSTPSPTAAPGIPPPALAARRRHVSSSSTRPPTRRSAPAPDHGPRPAGRRTAYRRRHPRPVHRRPDRAPRRGHRHRPDPPRRRPRPPPRGRTPRPSRTPCSRSCCRRAGATDDTALVIVQL